MDNSSHPPSRTPFKFTRRHALIGGMLMAAGAAAEWRRPQIVNPVVSRDDFLALVPDTAGQWQSLGAGDVVLPPPDTLSDRLYDNLVTRVYQGEDKEEIMLLLAYNNQQDGMLQVHRPEVCYPVGGYTLTDTQPTSLAFGSEAIPSSQFTAVGPSRTEHVTYFTRIGEAFPRTWSQQRTTVVQDNLRGIIPDGMMMRVSSLGADSTRAMSRMRDFSQEFYTAAPLQLRKLLIGKA